MNTLQIPLIYVISDNFDAYMTKEAYAEVRLQMSTGDFHMHTHVDVLSIDPMSFAAECEVYDLNAEFLELEVIGIVKDFIKGETK